ncbi:hexosaminidase D [Anabrus simplex]|uniref:hexosaminidase D n=1 Tax=Anabrus simplex TaxID=316456 RepID=UPI0035A3673C
MAPLYSRIRKSRHKQLIILASITVITVIFYIVHAVILSRANLSLIPSKSGSEWFNNKPLLMPLLADTDPHFRAFEAIDYYARRDSEKRPNSIAEVKGIVRHYGDNKVSDNRVVPMKGSKKNLNLQTGVGDQVQLRVVHLDFKGAPPKLEFLRTLFSMIAESGGNALLIEYEDMFPFDGMLRNLSAYNAYTKEQVVQLLDWARKSGLEVIPLVQTFGHLEYALKLPEFKGLRELASFPQELCPSLPASHEFVKELVRQIMALHKDTRYLHIGCDEVYHLAACGRCTSRHLDPSAIFTDHVTRVATHVRETYPGVTPLVWDDMFRHWSPMELSDSGLGALVEPVVWVYIEDVTHLVPHYVWYMYGHAFRNVWAASAFKGAFGETAVAPNLDRHLKNHISWFQVIESKTKRENQASTDETLNFRGIILTGWSRYDHFAVLCELLPVSVPSLILNLLYASLKRTKRELSKMTEQEELKFIFEVWLQHLSCPPYNKFDANELANDPYQWHLSTCGFPGSNLYEAIGAYLLLKSRVDSLYTDLMENHGWVSEYNVNNNYSSPFRVLEAGSGELVNSNGLFDNFRDFRNSTRSLLSQYYDQYTVDEWLEQKLDPIEKKIHFMASAAEKLINIDVWPRRPLNYKNKT